MEELEALKEAEETALKQAEIAAEEAARGLLGDIDLLDEVSLHTNDENHIGINFFIIIEAKIS